MLACMYERTKEDAEKTRQALLDAALTVFSSKGYQAARLQDIASTAGTTRGAIYHHFSNKVDLYKALIKEASQQGNMAIQTAVFPVAASQTSSNAFL